MDHFGCSKPFGPGSNPGRGTIPFSLTGGESHPDKLVKAEFDSLRRYATNYPPSGGFFVAIPSPLC